MAVGIFTEWNMLLYVAPNSATDEQALHTALRSGLELPQLVIVRRPNQPAKKYRVENGKISPARDE